METDKTKRDHWSHYEIDILLQIIKEKHILKLLSNKTKRNGMIYSQLEDDLKKQQIFKKPDQIRNKFKYLKCEYYKTKRRNNKNAAHRQTSVHFAVLDEMFSQSSFLLDPEISDSLDKKIDSSYEETSKASSPSTTGITRPLSSLSFAQIFVKEDPLDVNNSYIQEQEQKKEHQKHQHDDAKKLHNQCSNKEIDSYVNYMKANDFLEEESIARTWAHKLKRLSLQQRLLAEKFINDILFEAEFGTLQRCSMQLNTPKPNDSFHEMNKT